MSEPSLPSSASRSSAPNIQQSGRQAKSMSSARLEKKRRTDRESQRAGREKTKNYISHLEKLVESFEREPGDGRLRTLTQQCQQLRDQNEQLRATIVNIRRLAGSADLSDTARDSLTDSTTSPPDATSLTAPGDQQPIVDALSVTEKVIPLVSCPNPSLWVKSFSSFEGQQHQEPKSPMPLAASSLLDDRSIVYSPSAHAQTQVPSNSQVADISGLVPTCGNTEEAIFESVNDLLTMAELFTAISTTPGEDVDIAICAVINGWQVTSQKQALDEGWHVLSQIDEKVFFSCGTVERLAILLIMRLKLRHAVNLDAENLSLLPQFMRPRPVQMLIQHPSLYDYLPWPSLRDMFILSTSLEKRKKSDQFAPAFTASIRFQWPHDFNDTWTRNTCTDLYSLSATFYERFNDLQFWTLNSDFFYIRPDLIGYIPIYNPSPSTFFGQLISQADHDESCVEQIRGTPNNTIVSD